MSWGTDTAVRTLWQEARGELIDGQRAVAWTFRNRLADGRWGKTLASVCLWRGQFSGWYMPRDPNFASACALADDDKVLVTLRSILMDVLSASSSDDPTRGATHYVNLDVVAAPDWTQGATMTVKIGQHTFFKGVK